MKRWILTGAMFSVAMGASATVLLSDGFSGTTGTPLVGRSLEQGGGVWSNQRTDGPLLMTGTFSLTNGGVSAAGTDTGASIYTTFNAGAQTNGWALSATFVPGDDAPTAKFTLGMAETINKGHFQNLVADDVIRLAYYAGGADAGTFTWFIYDEGVQLNNDDSVRTGSEVVLPGDEIKLTITCYPLLGLIEGVAYNLTGGYELSKLRTAVNSPGLTNMLYAGMGLNSLAGTNSASRLVATSFSAETVPDYRSTKPLVMPDRFPIAMQSFSFQKVTNDVMLAEYLALHEPIEIIHSPRKSVFDAVRAAFPDKMVLHQDAYGGLGIFPEDITNAWPGHYLFRAATKLSATCTTNGIVLHVEDFSRLVADQAEVAAITNRRSSYLMIYALDGSGQPDWSRTEHVHITAVDTNSSTITVERGQWESVPQAFTNGQAVVARHVMYWDDTPGQIQLNLSLKCPRGGPFNMTASEWYALRKAQRIWQSGADGIEFDVGRWIWFNRKDRLDCDNDLVADYGYFDGINSFGFGTRVFLRNLRELLGPNKIIQMDSNDALGPRGWQDVNGVQMESFPSANHFDRFSETFRQFRQWTTHVTAQPAFSYPFTKAPTTLFGHVYDTDGSPLDWRFRVGMAAALLTGMPHPFDSITDINFDPENPSTNNVALDVDKDFYRWDEDNGGSLDDWAWLGRTQGDAIQVLDDLDGSNLLAGTAWEWKIETDFAADCTLSNGEYAAVVTAMPSNTVPWDTAYYAGSLVPQTLWFGVRLQAVDGTMPVLEPGSEYTLEFEAKGNDSWIAGGIGFDQIPRTMEIHGVADYGYSKQASVSLDPDWTLCRFSMIADDTPPPLCFGFSDQIGNASIRNVRLYKGGCERWTREFEHGRVYLNMALDPWTVPVGEGVVQRLVGTQIPTLNNGETVNGLLTIPAWDAVFLRTGGFEAWQSGQFGVAVSDDFSTGFDGRDVGDSLVGFNVQTGIGTWTNSYTEGIGTMNGSMAFVSGGGLTETVGGGGGAYVHLAGLLDPLSMEVVVTPNDFSSGHFTIGFVETIDKGFFVNSSSGDLLKMRYVASGANAGRFQFGVYDEGVLTNNVLALRSGPETVYSNDTVRLTLSCNMASGAITGTAYNVTGGYTLSSAAINVAGLSNMRNAGFGWSSITDQTTAPSANPGIVASFTAGNPLALLGASVTGDSADPDGDGFSNLQEYIAGTDPLDGQSQFFIAGGGFNGAEGVLDWSSVSGRVYDVYWTTNLLAPFVPAQTDIAWPQSSYTSSIPVGAKSGFYQIKVRRP